MGLISSGRVHMDNGAGRPWCNPSLLRPVLEGELPSTAVAVLFATTSDPMECNCPRCAPHARDLEGRVRQIIESILADKTGDSRDGAVRLLLDLVHGGGDLLAHRHNAVDYLEDLHECYCPCQGDHPETDVHIPACAAADEVD